ncbi:MAG: hypothetical protein ACYDH6_08705 [Acidimicrobiales bacterium]
MMPATEGMLRAIGLIETRLRWYEDSDLEAHREGLIALSGLSPGVDHDTAILELAAIAEGLLQVATLAMWSLHERGVPWDRYLGEVRQRALDDDGPEGVPDP